MASDRLPRANARDTNRESRLEVVSVGGHAGFREWILWRSSRVSSLVLCERDVMALDRILSATDIAASGLKAERVRMDVAANNIANAHATRTPGGDGPYRRQQVVFASVLGNPLIQNPDERVATLGGVRVVGVQSDQTTELPRVYNPAHPDADDDGFVRMPNVQIPHEMVDLLTASRSYEANLKSLQTFQRMAEQALSLLRGLS